MPSVAISFTTRHLVHNFQDAPFLIRFNRPDGTSMNVHNDGDLHWHFHPDDTVDLAAASFNVSSSTSGLDLKYLGEFYLADNELLAGVGDITYTIGLFRLLSGLKRNLPIVHCGSIALMPRDEEIPLRDWRDPTGETIIRARGFLVETHGMTGLSGSPVFVRPCIALQDLPLSQPLVPGETTATVALPIGGLLLLGVWQGSWGAPPDEVMAHEVARGARVPIGLGFVVPLARLKEILESEALKQQRREIQEARTAHEVTTGHSAQFGQVLIGI
jgi:hypothetical protein